MTEYIKQRGSHRQIVKVDEKKEKEKGRSIPRHEIKDVPPKPEEHENGRRV